MKLTPTVTAPPLALRSNFKIQPWIDLTQPLLPKTQRPNHNENSENLPRTPKMSEIEKIAAVIRQKQQDANDEKSKTMNLVGAWVNAVINLNKEIEKWIEPLKKQGLAAVFRGENRQYENQLTPPISYGVETLSIEMLGKKITFSPVTRTAVGSAGRVDIALNGANFKEETFLIRQNSNGNDSWEIVRRSQSAKVSREPLTEASFAGIIRELI